MPATITNYALPTVLYRFRSVGDVPDMRNKKLRQELSAITTGYVWCGEYHQLNDAMEGLYTAGDGARNQPGWNAARALIRDRKASLGLACFSEVPESPLMWAHYADAFRGICIEYDFEVLRSGLPDATSFCRISYADRMLDVGTNLRDTDTLARWIMATKSQGWAYEREWRLFAPTQGAAQYVSAPIRRVLAGPRMPEAMFDYLQGQMPAVPIVKAQIDGYRVHLD
ncbi:hypothetical protein ASC68_19615 [Devosia sp. Root105]|nr:hypothetical protein ASC68_19615 [Devosia sp. Root105]